MPEDFHVSAKAVLVRGPDILVLKHDAGLDLPGGRLESGEDPKVGLARELAEELPGISGIEVGDLVGWHRYDAYPVEERNLLVLLFLVEASLPNPIRLSDEHTQFVWMPLDQFDRSTPDFDIHWNASYCDSDS